MAVRIRECGVVAGLLEHVHQTLQGGEDSAWAKARHPWIPPPLPQAHTPSSNPCRQGQALPPFCTPPPLPLPPPAMRHTVVNTTTAAATYGRQLQQHLAAQLVLREPAQLVQLRGIRVLHKALQKAKQANQRACTSGGARRTMRRCVEQPHLVDDAECLMILLLLDEALRLLRRFRHGDVHTPSLRGASHPWDCSPDAQSSNRHPPVAHNPCRVAQPAAMWVSVCAALMIG